MNNLQVFKGRTRSLSITSFTDGELHKMNDSLDNLRRDLSLIGSFWNKVLTKDTNPLELALNFLDDTSVGLGHRYSEFHQLKSQIANDLQEAVNEHYQAFNSSIASYGQTVKYLNESRESITEVEKQVGDVMNSLSNTTTELEELNDELMVQSKMIEMLTAIQEVLNVAEKVEELISIREFGSALQKLVQGFTLAKNHHLWSIPILSTTKQQLEQQEHMLFEAVIDELTEIVYSRKKSMTSELTFLDDTGKEDCFSSLESYLHQVVSIDISEQSSKMNAMLNGFMEKIESNSDNLTSTDVVVRNESAYERIFVLLNVLSDMNRISPALELLAERNPDELHLIVVSSGEGVRSKFPGLLKMIDTRKKTEFGISGKDFLSVVLRKQFWEIFTKFIIAAQSHRVIYEFANRAQPSSPTSYPYIKVWDDILNEVSILLHNYTNDASLQSQTNSIHAGPTATTLAKEKKSLFSLQANLVDTNTTRNHANELKSLLQDMFPGFNSNISTGLDKIYLEDIASEEESLIPLTVFNMKIMLESLLVFVQGTKTVIPSEYKDTATPSLVFFRDYMNNTFLPLLDRTLNCFYEQQVESNNPHTLETIGENHVILKTAVDFKALFAKLLYVMNTGYTYREGISLILLSLLERFYRYYCNMFQSLLSSANSQFNKKLVATWLDDSELVRITEKITHGDNSYLAAETEAMLKHCPDYETKTGIITRNDFFSGDTIDTITYFLGTLTWISDWLPKLKQEVNQEEYKADLNDIEKLRANWSFFEDVEMEKLDRIGTLRFLVTGQSLVKFEKIVKGFLDLEYKLLGCLRYDVRARCIYNITEMLHTSKWNPDATSIDLNPYITTLTSEIGMLENKLSQRSSEHQRQVTFIGISQLVNTVFVNCARSIKVLNTHGIKKIIRNTNVLQQSFRNISSTPEVEDMSLTLNFFSMCSMNENVIVNNYNEGKLSQYSLDQVKQIIRLQFSEEFYRKLKRKSSTRVVSITSNKRYEDAISKLSA